MIDFKCTTDYNLLSEIVGSCQPKVVLTALGIGNLFCLMDCVKVVRKRAENTKQTNKTKQKQKISFNTRFLFLYYIENSLYFD